MALNPAGPHGPLAGLMVSSNPHSIHTQLLRLRTQEADPLGTSPVSHEAGTLTYD
jgi:hypothetical protein